ncbi:hypothetical protein WDU94_001519 [Cyamophila willieti]
MSLKYSFFRVRNQFCFDDDSATFVHLIFQIKSYLKYISRIYGHKVNVSTIGETFEGRPIQAIKISHGGSGNENPTILMDGGIHAREWISPAMVLYVLHQLVEHPENFPMLRKVDWLLIPLLNPDGYVYSMTKDRMWRKNRAKPKNAETNQCHGVDLNRNFGVFRRRRHIVGKGKDLGKKSTVLKYLYLKTFILDLFKCLYSEESFTLSNFSGIMIN